MGLFFCLKRALKTEENWHVTLQFSGTTSKLKINSIYSNIYFAACPYYWLSTLNIPALNRNKGFLWILIADNLIKIWNWDKHMTTNKSNHLLILVGAKINIQKLNNYHHVAECCTVCTNCITNECSHLPEHHSLNHFHPQSAPGSCSLTWPLTVHIITNSI